MIYKLTFDNIFPVLANLVNLAQLKVMFELRGKLNHLAYKHVYEYIS